MLESDGGFKVKSAKNSARFLSQESPTPRKALPDMAAFPDGPPNTPTSTPLRPTMLDFDGTSVPDTSANRALWRIWSQPGIWIFTLGHLERSAKYHRLTRAAEAIRAIDPLLAATLRDIEWRGDWCRLVR